MVTNVTIYERIKELRQAKGMSQYDLAKKVGYEAVRQYQKLKTAAVTLVSQ